jgi:hypothetical protein
LLGLIAGQLAGGVAGLVLVAALHLIAGLSFAGKLALALLWIPSLLTGFVGLFYGGVRATLLSEPRV